MKNCIYYLFTGDSGGGMLCNYKNEFILTGITLSAEHQSLGSDPEGNVFLHLNTYYEWIKKATKLLETENEFSITRF